MTFHRVILVALATLFSAGTTSMASAARDGGYAAPADNYVQSLHSPMAAAVAAAALLPLPPFTRCRWHRLRLRSAPGGCGWAAAGVAGAAVGPEVGVVAGAAAAAPVAARSFTPCLRSTSPVRVRPIAAPA